MAENKEEDESIKISNKIAVWSYVLATIPIVILVMFPRNYIADVILLVSTLLILLVGYIGAKIVETLENN